MAAGVAKAPSYQAPFPGSRSNDFAVGYVSPLSYNTTTGMLVPGENGKKLPTFTSIKALRDEDRNGAAPKSSRQHALRSTLRNIDTRMSPTTTTTTTTTTLPSATTKRSDSQGTKLHKRGSSASSLPISPATINSAHSLFPTPFATYEDPFPDIPTTTPTTTSTPKLKPYLRKLSSAGKEDLDQGRLDLSKSVSENEALAGLGIQDFGIPTRSDSLQTGRGTPHTRNASVGSTLSAGSGSFRPTQPFVHPMRQIPNQPYTLPPDASSLDDEETRESSDIVTDDDVVGHPTIHPTLRPNRSTSLSSTAQQTTITPTPLSQSHTPADLGYVPKLTSSSQSNLSIKSSKSKLSRARADTNRSFEHMPGDASSRRTSLDKAFSFVSRRSDPSTATTTTDPTQSRDERIRAARRKFDAKEASKERKEAEKEELRRRQSEVDERQLMALEKKSSSSRSDARRQQRPRRSERRDEELRGLRYDESRVGTALPRQGTEPGKSEKGEREAMAWEDEEASSSNGGWTRFSAWLQTRMLSCGRKGS